MCKFYLFWIQFALSVMLLSLGNEVAAEQFCKGFNSPGNPFACGDFGNCTWWAAHKRGDLKVTMLRSAKYWYDEAKKVGFETGQQPRKDAVAVFSIEPFGHVAYVEKVYTDGSFDVSEMDATGQLGNGVLYSNYKPLSGRYSRNGGGSNWSLIGFIYPKGMTEAENFCDPTKRKCDLSVYGNIGWFPAIPVCQQATQWFNLAVVNGEKVAVGTTTSANCPLVCVAH